MTDDMFVRLADLPNDESMDFRTSSYFINHKVELPSPDDVRQQHRATTDRPVNMARPPPVVFKERGLLVKFGSEITIAEAQCLWFFNRHMKDKVPTPELYGWRLDGGETFIYMQLVYGETLEERWPFLSGKERISICRELKSMVEAWRGLRQEDEPYFLGQIGRQGVGDIIFRDAGNPNAGPFKDIGVFHDFFARYSCRLHPEWNPRRDFPELAGLTDNQPVVFTHADLHRSNILISPQGAKLPPRVVAVIDWHQSGWYPLDWEWLKAQRSCQPIGSGRRDSDWLKDIMAPADNDYFYAWEYVNSSLGC